MRHSDVRIVVDSSITCKFSVGSILDFHTAVKSQLDVGIFIKFSFDPIPFYLGWRPCTELASIEVVIPLPTSSDKGIFRRSDSKT